MSIFSKAKKFVKRQIKSVKKMAKSVYKTVKTGVNTLLGVEMAKQMEKATKQQEQAAKEAQQQYADEIARAQETAELIANQEEERKRRLAAQGSKAPKTLLGSYAGVGNAPLIRRTTLG